MGNGLNDVGIAPITASGDILSLSFLKGEMVCNYRSDLRGCFKS